MNESKFLLNIEIKGVCYDYFQCYIPFLVQNITIKNTEENLYQTALFDSNDFTFYPLNVCGIH